MSRFFNITVPSNVPRTDAINTYILENSFDLFKLNNSGFKATLSPTTLTGNRTYTFPNSTGTVPLLETSNIWTGKQTIRANETESLRIDLQGTGVASTGYIAFYENDGSTLLFRVGNSSSGNHNLELIADQASCSVYHKESFTVYRNGILDLGISVGGFSSQLIYNLTSASAANVYVNSTGYLLRSTSARKYKDNIEKIADSSILYKIEGITYTSKCENDKGSKHIGIIADQVHETEDPILRLLVSYGENNEIEGFQYERVIPLLIEEMKKLNERIKILEAKNV